MGRKLAILLVAKVQIHLDLDKMGDWVENVLHHQHQHHMQYYYHQLLVGFHLKRHHLSLIHI